MTAAEQPDPVRAFVDALTPAARHHWYHGVSAYDAIPLIRIACERHTPAELAKTVSAGITRTQPINAGARILFRLQREAGQLDNDQEGRD